MTEKLMGIESYLEARTKELQEALVQASGQLAALKQEAEQMEAMVAELRGELRGLMQLRQRIVPGPVQGEGEATAD